MKTYVVGQVPSGYAPLPPENVLINGARYPADISGQYTISWAPNPREHVHGPAVSGDETYTLRLYDETDTLRRTVTGITGDSYTWVDEVADSALGDPNWATVTSLLHFDGANGSATFIDERGHTWTGGAGAVISTAQSKFGGASLTGGAVYTTSYDGTITGDFTVEAQVYITGATTLNVFRIGNEATGRVDFYIENGQLKVDKYAAFNAVLGSQTVPYNTLTHAAFARSGGVIKGYINGVACNAPYSTSVSLGNSAECRINQLPQSGYYIDEFRFEKTRAKYTANFTPPTAAFANSSARRNSSIRAELETVRDGVTSYQKQVVKTLRSVTTV